jgi:hypothetical protein
MKDGSKGSIGVFIGLSSRFCQTIGMKQKGSRTKMSVQSRNKDQRSRLFTVKLNQEATILAVISIHSSHFSSMTYYSTETWPKFKQQVIKSMI